MNALLTVASLTNLAYSATTACTGTISSLNDVANAVKCTTVNINSFTVPAGQALTLSLLQGTTVNMLGDVTFGVANWAGPLFTVSGTDITFNGNGHKFDGNGPSYWDGLGGNGGVEKPAPMMKIKISGVYKDVTVVNSPARTYSVSNPAALTMTGLTIDNSLGDQPNSKSNGEPAGHNTDGFDCSTHNLVISNSNIHNQDDCLAINSGSNITFTGNTCTGGHGISVGSISSDAVVTDIHITNNKVVNNDQALRIKTKSDATSASVSGVTYSGNTATGCKRFGVIIDQSYPDTLGTPGNGVTISDITFSGTTSNIAVASGAQRVAVNCGSGSCTGTWNWSALKVSGGSAGTINYSGITGFQQ
ncbi:endo-polygalacturonase PG1 [Marasmius fiardii PR-910]|nr:endo-polygalacturonase PG1 [Marasmius fiardii PR-910]